MDDSVKRYRERRDARIKERRARVDDQWITMRGTHVLIDDGGQVSKGPEKLRNVVKQGGGYKSKAERKYGSNDKFSKFLNNGWNTSNRNVPPSGAKSSVAVPKKGSPFAEVDPDDKGLAQWAKDNGYKSVWAEPTKGKSGETLLGGRYLYTDKYGRTVAPDDIKEARKKWMEKEKKAGGSSSERESGKTGSIPEWQKLTKSGKRSMKYTAGDISMEDLRQEVKKLIDKKGLKGLIGQDYLDLKDKYGIDGADWQNAVGYWEFGAGKKKLGKK